MQWLWTWGGASFGYKDGDDLWTHDGRHVGRFHGDGYVMYVGYEDFPPTENF